MRLYVKHTLDKKGKKAGMEYAPEWLKELETAMSQFDGYQSTKRLQDEDDGATLVFQVAFDSIEQFKVWAKSDAHNEIIPKLDPFRSKLVFSRLETGKEETPFKSLTWTEINAEQGPRLSKGEPSLEKSSAAANPASITPPPPATDSIATGDNPPNSAAK